MKLIFCLDDRNGMMFNFRRQSMDKVLRQRVLKMAESSRIIMSPYSAKQFIESGNIVVSDTPQSIAASDDFYFVEDLPFSAENASEIIIYRWNRHYPADKYFDADIKSLGYSVYSSENFEGSSHEKITEEKYRKDLTQ